MAAGVNLLTWDELDAARGPLDLAPARTAVTQIVAQARMRGPKSGRRQPLDLLEDDIDRALIERYGAWAMGWNWACSEPGGGGLVRAWCCPEHSLFRRGEPPEATVERVLAALMGWHEVIGALAAEFGRLVPADGASLAEIVEHAAAALVAWVVERTDATDAWHGTFAAVLAWYLQAWALDGAGAGAEIERVVSGRFESWIAPDAAKLKSTCAELGAAIAVHREAELPDATLAWIGIRRSTFAHVEGSSMAPREPMDGHRRFIEGLERRRDPVRAERMLAALDACRRAAREGVALDFELLARWNAIALGLERSDYREVDAYAKQGRERYGTAVGDQTFVAYLSDANDSTTPRAIRAARVYLDVCFFHPFADGNARAARLALDYVLAREGIGLHVAEPLFVIARSANDRRGPWYFAWMIERLSVRLP